MTTKTRKWVRGHFYQGMAIGLLCAVIAVFVPIAAAIYAVGLLIFKERIEDRIYKK